MPSQEPDAGAADPIARAAVPGENGVINVGFPKVYQFHKEILEKPNNKKLIEEVLTGILKAQVKVEFKLVDNLQRKNNFTLDTEPFDEKELNVLIYEISFLNVRAIKHILTPFNLNILSSINTKAIINDYKKFSPDVVFLEFENELVIQVIADIRKYERDNNIKKSYILLLARIISKENTLNVILSGANNILLYPIVKENLFMKLKEII